MIKLYLFSLKRFSACLRPVGATDGKVVRRSLRARLLFILFVPTFLVAHTAQWILLTLDELLFRGYHQLSVNSPVFITGVPRSGTTLLHRTLAKDEERFVTCRTRDLIAGPSLCGQSLFNAVSNLDRCLGKPLHRLFSRLTRKAENDMATIHPLDIDAPEEDFIWLWPMSACFLLFLIRPDHPMIWRLARLDHEASPAEQDALTDFYARCIQKKLYRSPPGKFYLAKNPSFTLWHDSLFKRFPDARWITCMRDLNEAIPSQLSSLRPALQACGIAPSDPVLSKRFTDLLQDYAQSIQSIPNDAQHACVQYSALTDSLEKTVLDLAQSLSLPLSPAFLRDLPRHSENAARYRSCHRYSTQKTQQKVQNQHLHMQDTLVV